MSKTLADMAPEQRAACVGMWCDVRVPFKDNQQNLLILTHVDNELKRATVFGTNVNETWPKSFQDITPRFDLPRTWTADGEPVPGKWLHLRKGDLTGWEHGFSAPPDEDKDLVKSLLAPNEPLIRHFVSEWEEITND